MLKELSCKARPDRRGVLMLVGIAGAVCEPFFICWSTVGGRDAQPRFCHRLRVAAKQRVLGDKVSQTAAVLRYLWVDHISGYETFRSRPSIRTRRP